MAADPLDRTKPLNLARTIAALKLKYVVITSVGRDDRAMAARAISWEYIQRIRENSRPARRSRSWCRLPRPR